MSVSVRGGTAGGRVSRGHGSAVGNDSAGHGSPVLEPLSTPGSHDGYTSTLNTHSSTSSPGTYQSRSGARRKPSDSYRPCARSMNVALVMLVAERPGSCRACSMISQTMTTAHPAALVPPGPRPASGTPAPHRARSRCTAGRRTSGSRPPPPCRQPRPPTPRHARRGALRPPARSCKDGRPRNAWPAGTPRG